MEQKGNDDYEKEYAERFEWRKSRQIANLKELSEFAQSGGADAIAAFPGLHCVLASDDPKDALKRSILELWCEAAECYVFGEFQSCVLTCGAIVERCLKLEYETAYGALPTGKHWTLGTCMGLCNGLVAQDVLDLARSMLEPRNNRAHALLEHSDPDLALRGGAKRGIEIRSPQDYLIEPFRGDAKSVIAATHQILAKLHGKNETILDQLGSV